MKILITGGSGFIGSSLIQSGVLSGQMFYPSHLELDLLDYHALRNYLRKNQITHIIHSATFSALSISRDNGFDYDLRMFNNIRTCNDLVEKIVYFGSGAEFDKSRSLIKVKEESWGKFAPKDSYGQSKYEMLKVSRNTPNIINLRLFGVFGRNENYKYKFISNTIAKHVLGMPIVIKQDVIFDYLNVSDLTLVVKYFLGKTGKYQDYNVTPTISTKLSEVVSCLEKISNHESNLKILNKGHNNQYTGSNKRLLSEMSNLRFTSLNKSIRPLYKYYSDSSSFLSREDLKEDEFLEKAIIKNSLE